MKKVFVKGFAFAAVVALSFTNISCEQKPEENVEAAAEDAVEAAEAANEAAVDANEAAVDAAEAANEATDAAAVAPADAPVETPATEEPAK